MSNEPLDKKLHEDYQKSLAEELGIELLGNIHAVAYTNAVLNGEPDEVINRHLANMNADLNRILNEEESDES